MMPADILIRTAGIDEKRALEDLQLRASLANEGDRKHLLENPGIISTPDAQLLSGLVCVACRHTERLGFAAMLQNDDGTMELDGLFVEPAHWRSGIGRQLVEHCISVAREAKAPAIHVIANPHALDFYRSCGFEETGTAQTLFGPAITMRLKL